jgi:hypothetical protein
VETGVQTIYNYLKRLDSGVRRNDEKSHFQTFYETINYQAAIFNATYFALRRKLLLFTASGPKN